jgi:hypothetical protein
MYNKLDFKRIFSRHRVPVKSNRACLGWIWKARTFAYGPANVPRKANSLCMSQLRQIGRSILFERQVLTTCAGEHCFFTPKASPSAWTRACHCVSRAAGTLWKTKPCVIVSVLERLSRRIRRICLLVGSPTFPTFTASLKLRIFIPSW